jgi:hypothetical protein
MGIAGVRLRLPLETSKLENRKAKLEKRKSGSQEPRYSNGTWGTQNKNRPKGPTKQLPGDPGDYARADQ